MRLAAGLRTCWGSYSAPPNPVAVIRWRGEERRTWRCREGRKGERRKGRGKGRAMDKCFAKAFQCTRMRGIAQYAVLEANAKVNGRGPFSHPHPSETPQPISMSCQIYYYVPQESWCAKFSWNRLGRYGSAHAWKYTILSGFLLIIIIKCFMQRHKAVKH